MVVLGGWVTYGGPWGVGDLWWSLGGERRLQAAALAAR